MATASSKKEAATAAGIQERVFLNTKGQICEGAVSNIFFVRKNKIYTPQLNCGLLPGILREYVREKFEVNETVIYPEELMYYDECFCDKFPYGSHACLPAWKHLFPTQNPDRRSPNSIRKSENVPVRRGIFFVYKSSHKKIDKTT